MAKYGLTPEFLESQIGNITYRRCEKTYERCDE